MDFDAEFAAFEADIADLGDEGAAGEDQVGIEPVSQYDSAAAAYSYSSSSSSAVSSSSRPIPQVIASAPYLKEDEENERRRLKAEEEKAKRLAKDEPKGKPKLGAKRKTTEDEEAEVQAEKKKQIASHIVSSEAVPALPEVEPFVAPVFAISLEPPAAAAAAAASAQAAAEGKKSGRHFRFAAGKVWEDKSLSEWPENDHRIFCGDLGNEVNDQSLGKIFMKYPSFARAKVVRDPKTSKSRGYGFVSFLDPVDCASAIREMQGKYVGNRPVKLRKSTSEKRDIKAGKIKKALSAWEGV